MANEIGITLSLNGFKQFIGRLNTIQEGLAKVNTSVLSSAKALTTYESQLSKINPDVDLSKIIKDLRNADKTVSAFSDNLDNTISEILQSAGSVKKNDVSFDTIVGDPKKISDTLELISKFAEQYAILGKAVSKGGNIGAPIESFFAAFNSANINKLVAVTKATKKLSALVDIIKSIRRLKVNSNSTNAISAFLTSFSVISPNKLSKLIDIGPKIKGFADSVIYAIKTLSSELNKDDDAFISYTKEVIKLANALKTLAALKNITLPKIPKEGNNKQAESPKTSGLSDQAVPGSSDVTKARTAEIKQLTVIAKLRVAADKQASNAIVVNAKRVIDANKQKTDALGKQAKIQIANALKIAVAERARTNSIINSEPLIQNEIKGTISSLEKLLDEQKKVAAVYEEDYQNSILATQAANKKATDANIDAIQKEYEARKFLSDQDAQDAALLAQTLKVEADKELAIATNTTRIKSRLAKDYAKAVLNTEKEIAKAKKIAADAAEQDTKALPKKTGKTAIVKERDAEVSQLLKAAQFEVAGSKVAARALVVESRKIIDANRLKLKIIRKNAKEQVGILAENTAETIKNRKIHLDTDSIIASSSQSVLESLKSQAAEQSRAAKIAESEYKKALEGNKSANKEASAAARKAIQDEYNARQDVSNKNLQQIALESQAERVAARERLRISTDLVKEREQIAKNLATVVKDTESAIIDITDKTAAAQKKAAKAAKELVQEQHNLNVSFLLDNLKEGTTAVEKFAFNIISARNAVASLSVGTKEQFSLVGIKALALLFKSITFVPNKAINSLVGSLTKLGIVVKNIALDAFNSALSAVKSKLNDIATAAQNAAIRVAKLAAAIISSPINYITKAFIALGNSMKAAGAILFALIKKIVSISVSFATLLARITLITTAFKLLIAPIKALNNAFGFIKNTISKGISEISPELENIEKSANDAGNGIEGLNDNLSTLNDTSKFFKKAAVSIVGLTVAYKSLQKTAQLVGQAMQRVRVAVTNTIGSAFQAASTYEQLTLSFTALSKLELKETGVIGNAASLKEFSDEAEIVKGRVQELLKWVRVLAIQSPFQEKDVAETLKFALALGFSTDEAKTLTQAVTDFGAGIGGTPDQIKSVVRALGQMAGGATLAKEEVNQLRDAGFRKPFQKLADALGVTVPEAVQAITDKTIDAKKAVAIFVKAMQDDFSGAAAQATKSLSGLSSTIKSLKDNVSREFFTPVFEIFKPLIAAFTGTDQIETLLDSARALGEQFASHVYDAVVKVLKVFATLKALFDAARGTIIELTKKYGRFAAELLIVAAALSSVVLILPAITGALVALLNPITLAITAFVHFRTSILNTFSAASNAVISFWNNIKGGLEAAYNVVLGFVKNTGKLLSDFTVQLFTYGQNIGISLANGITDAVQYVVAAVGNIAQAISYWLSPGSPPKALPDIDKWGTAAANEFLGGFTDADFGLIEDYGATISDLITSLELDPSSFNLEELTLSFADLVSALKNNDVNDNNAITTFMTTLREQTGAAQNDFANFANEYVKLAQEQAKLNQLTDDYNSNLKAANSELDKISRDQTFADQNEELANLNKALNNKYLTSAQKDKLELKRRKVIAEMQKSDVDAQGSVVDQQKSQIELMKRRLGLSSKFDKSNTAANGGANSAASALAKLKKEKVDGIGADLTEGLSGALEPIANISSALDDLDLPTFDLNSIFGDAEEKVTGILDNLKDKFGNLGITLKTAKIAAAGFVAALVAPTIIKNMLAAGSAIKTIVAALGPLSTIGLVAAGGIALIAGGLLIFSDKLTPEFFSSLSDSFATLGTNIKDFFDAFKGGLGGDTDVSAFTSLQDIADGLLNFDASTFAAQLGVTVGKMRESIVNSLVSLGESIKTTIITYITAPFMEAFTLNDDPMFDSRTLFQRILDGIIASTTSIGSKIKEVITSFVSDNIISPFTSGFNGADGNIGEKLLAGISSVFEPLGAQIVAKLSGVIDVEAIKTTVQDKIIQPFIDAFNGSAVDGAIISFGDRIVNGVKAIFDNNQILVNLNDLITFGSNDVSILNQISKSLTEFGNAIPKNILNAFIGIFNDFKQSFEESDLGSKLLTLAGSLLTLGKNVAMAIAAIAGFLLILSSGFIGELPDILSHIIDIITNVVDAVNDLVNVIVAAFTGGDVIGAVNALLSDILGIKDGLINLAIDILQAIVGSVVTGLRLLGVNISDELSDLFKDLVTFWIDLLTLNITGAFKAVDFTEAIPLLFSAILSIFEAALTKVASMLPDKIKGIFTGVFDTFKTVADTMKSIIDFATQFGSMAVQDPFEAIHTTLSNITTAIETLATSLSGFISDNLNIVLPNPFSALYDTLVVIITAVADLTLALVNFVKDRLNIVFPNPFQTITGTLSDIIMSISDLTDVLVTFVSDRLNITLPNPFEIEYNALLIIISTLDDLTSALIKFVNERLNITLPNPFTPIRKTLEAIPDIIASVTSKFSEFSSFISNLDIPNPFGALSDGITGIFNRDNKPDTNKASDGVVDAYIGEIDNKLSNSTVTVNSDILDTNIDTFKEDGVNAGEAVMEGTASGISGKVDSAKDALTDAASGIKDKWNSLWDSHSPSEVAREEMGVPIGEGILLGIQDTLVNLTDNFKGEFANILTISPESVTSFVEIFTNLFGDISELLSDFVDDFTDTLNTFIDDMLDLLTTAFDNTTSLVDDTFSEILDSLTSFDIQVLVVLKRLMSSIKNVMKQFETIMKDAAQKGVDAFLNILDGFGDDVKNKLSDELGFLSDTGKDSLYEYMKDSGNDIGNALIAGIIDGINDKIRDLKDAAARAVQAAASAAKEAGNIHSPSRLMLEEVGKPLMDGLILGITGGTNTFADATGNSVITAMNAAKSKLQGAEFNPIDLPFNIDKSIGVSRVKAQGVNDMRSLQNRSIVNNINYTMNMTVKESQVQKVRRNFNKMRDLRAV